MEHSIRAAALVVDDDRLLLVQNQHPVTGFEFWIPPGGGLENDESIYECAIRETREETGLTVTLGSILYIGEFLDLEIDCHYIEVFILASGFEGKLSNDNWQPAERNFIKSINFLSRHEMSGLNVSPDVLKNEFWDVIKADVKPVTYLGQQSSESN